MRTPTDLTPLWAYWTSAMAGEPVTPPEEPQCGYYRVQRQPHVRALNGGKRAPFIDQLIRLAPAWTPCAFWMHQELDETGGLADDERFLVLLRGRFIAGRDIDALWLRCRTQPISYEAYQHALEHREWSDDVPRPPRPGKPALQNVMNLRSLF